MTKQAAMTPDQFKEWMAAMGYRQSDAAEALGLSLDTIKSISSGRRVAGLTVALSCNALYHRLEPWGHKDGAANTTETSSR